MKKSKSFTLNLVVALGMILATLPVGALAETPAATQAPQPQADTKPPTWDDLAPEIQAKVDPRLLAELRGDVIPAHLGGAPAQADVAAPPHKPLEQTRFLVHLKAQANLERVTQQRFSSKVAQRRAVFDALVNTAQATQGPIKTLLNTRMAQGDVASFQPFYIFNGLAVEGDLDTIIALAQRDDVERIVANYPLVFLSGHGDGVAAPTRTLDPGNWNIDLVNADRVWDEFGITGQGAVVGDIDTGADWTHPALQSKYRGYDAGGPGVHVHDYNWFDPDPTLYPGGDLGPSRSVVPFDFGDHGTHTLGTMVGDGGPGNQVGMAPGAQWIAVSLNELLIAGSVADDIMAHKAFQWMLCPTDLSGALATANCALAPDVVNNSWGDANPADDTLRPGIVALRAAGVAPVFAAGNPLAGPGSIGSPGNAPEAITVGATDINDAVASFSGRGPSFYEGEQKPELSAPGVNINSTLPGGGYSGPTWSGTSMAAPAVSGLVALMVSADLLDGARDFDVDELEAFMEYTAVDLGDPGPDDDYGYGRIDAYNAVRWVLSAGDLRGTVTDANTLAPIEDASVTGVQASSGDTFTGASDASGAYAVTVPAGVYDITVAAWGYQDGLFGGQTVVTGTLSLANFALTPLPTAQLSGHVFSGTTPVNGALVYVADAPDASATTGADGAYSLTLPVGTQAMVVEANGYRILHEDVSLAGGGSSHDFNLTPAPTILLVDADTYGGWYLGWPVRNYFGWALDYENYLHDTWVIQYTAFTDTQVMTDSSLGYGIPSTTTLGAYDVVVWAHGAQYYGLYGSPASMGADDELMAYLDGGGGLILSGQDIGYNDSWATYFDDYLHADYDTDAAAGEGDTLGGDDFLAGLDLEITNASLHGYPNGATYLSPDAVSAQDGAAYPVMSYDNGAGNAVLAVDPCNADYRAVYWAVGFENVAPRAYVRDPDIAAALDRSIQWAQGSKATYDVSVAATPSSQTSGPGSIVTYDLQVINRGAAAIAYTLDLSGNTWPTRVLSGTVEVTLTADIPPCGLQELSVEVDVPSSVNAGERDTATVTAMPYVGGAPLPPGANVDVTTLAFPQWQIEAPMPTPRYRLAATNEPDSLYYYAIGGQGGSSWGDPMNANERYNACSGQWESLTPMPTARGNVGAAVIEGQVYAPGGYDGTLATPYLDVLEIYDTATDTWSSGAPMPAALSGAAVAAYGGKLYTFGGSNAGGYVASTYEYDPASDTWTTKAPMPNGARAYAAAAEMDGLIYVAGGWQNENVVEVYDPANDSWSTVAPMNVGRQSAGLVAAPDGYLYVSGGGNGWAGLNSAERYDPASDTWIVIPTLNDSDRAGSASAYAAGRIFAIGGSGANLNDVNESLPLSDTFCNSAKSVWQSSIGPGERITYTIEIHSNASDLTGASVIDPLPAGTTWAGFGLNPIGATYNGGADQVEWSGAVPANSPPLTFTFGVDVAMAGWTFGDPITNVATFDGGAGQVFSRTAVTTLDFPEPSPSTKSVDKSQALAGDVLTYTLVIKNSSVVSDTFSLRDPIPDHATYVPGSLTATVGMAWYDGGQDAVHWTGVLPNVVNYVNTSGGWEWGDSDGNGDVSVNYDWVDISSTGTPVYLGDDDWVGPLGIGFAFDFFGNSYTDLAIGSNGAINFNIEYTTLDNQCPLPSASTPNNLIALMWDDLDPGDTGDPVYYQTFAACPAGGGQCLVVQYDNYHHYYPGGSAMAGTFEAILFDSGAILIQFLDAGDELGSGSTTGIENADGTQGLTYACNVAGSPHDELAVVFVPDGAAWQGITSKADLTFAVTTDAPLPLNTWITNTAAITGSLNVVERSAATLLNPVDLGDSTKIADKSQATVGEMVTYDLALKNTGLMAATGASLNDPLPACTAYVPASLTCDAGICDHDAGAVTWSGDIAPGGSVHLSFAVSLTTPLDDLTPVTNTATLDDGSGDLYALQAVFDARSSDLSHSFKVADPPYVQAGGTVTYTIYIHNSGVVEAPNEMRDVLPPELTYVPGSLTCPGGTLGLGSCDYDAGVVTWTGLAPAHTIAPVRFQATVPGDASHGDVIVNSATVTDLVWMAGYPASAEVMVVAPADLWLTKSGAGVVEAGGTLVYTITYGNDGPFETMDVVQVMDVLPTGASYVDSSPAGAYDGTAGMVTWDVGMLNAGVSGTILLTAKVNAGVPALTVLTNTASIEATSQDLDTTNNTDRVLTVVGSNVNLLDSTKTADPPGVPPGETLTYTIALFNSGNVAANVTITDPIPDGASYVLGSSELNAVGAGLYNDASDSIEWQGPVAPGDTVTIRFQAQITASGGTMVVNAVTIDDGAGMVFERQVAVPSMQYDIYLPLVLRLGSS